MKTLLSAIFILSLIGCGGAEDGKFKKNYRFKINGCDTKTHSFRGNSEASALQKMCRALSDDGLNNNCAFQQRCQLYDSSCPGTEWEACDTYMDRNFGEDESPHLETK